MKYQINKNAVFDNILWKHSEETASFSAKPFAKPRADLEGAHQTPPTPKIFQ